MIRINGFVITLLYNSTVCKDIYKVEGNGVSIEFQDFDTAYDFVKVAV